MKKTATATKKTQTRLFSKSRLLLFATGLIIGVASGYLTTFLIKWLPRPIALQETRAGGYRFINPLLDCDNFQIADNKRLSSLKKELSNYVNNTLTTKSIKHISIYYRDLNNGPWLGINEHENLSPANVSRVPLLIALLKRAETDTGFLKKEIPFTPQINSSAADKAKIADSKTLFSVGQLIELMLNNQDNEARAVLEKLMGYDYLAKVVKEMGIIAVQENYGSKNLSVKDYTSFFRILYNASFLSREMSEKALELMSKSGTKQGIATRLPADVIVSHQYGEISFRIRLTFNCRTAASFIADTPHFCFVLWQKATT
ncbi:MAG TPA: serine hydrolase [Bacteroidales bacterium]|nr:serine hydrolase [Bacteroidales bacterium]HQP15965.1 serine hydrolase [Bacteroidales bacterium]